MAPHSQRVLITGAANGIGRALAVQAVDAGHRVVLADRDQQTLEALAAQLGDRAVAVPTDVTDASDVARAIQAATDRFGGTDVLVNCAGVAVYSRAVDLSLADWDKVLKVNLHGVVHTIHAVLPQMLERGSGQIINIASMQGVLAMPFAAPYCASKFAVIGLSRALRMEVEDSGVDVLIINPGVVRTHIMSRAKRGTVRVFGRDIAVTQAHSEQLLKSSMGISPERAARQIWKAARRGSGEVSLGVDASLAISVARYFPTAARWLIQRAS